MVPGSRVSVRNVGTNPTRTGILDILRDMGAALVVEPLGEDGGEPVANLHVEHDVIAGRTIGGEWVTRAIDEIPALAAIAARAKGTTTIRDAAELRVKESDRIAAMVTVLRAFGVECEPLEDGMRLLGTHAPLHAATVESLGDHRIAMSAALLALCADGPSTIRDAGCIGRASRVSWERYARSVLRLTCGRAARIVVPWSSVSIA